MQIFDNQDWVWGIGLMLSGLFFAIAAARFRDERFQVPYRVLLPPERRVRNLLVVNCPSAGADISKDLRHPATAMALGHAAGLAAKLAIDTEMAVQELDTAQLARMLDRQGAILH